MKHSSAGLMQFVLCSAGDGLPGITLTFDSARVMYGFCSLKEPAAALPRYILINWVSPGSGGGEVMQRQTPQAIHTHTHTHTHTNRDTRMSY